jgi:hypothetical protein
MQQSQRAPIGDHEHAERVRRWVSAANHAIRDANAAGLKVEVAIVSVHTSGIAHEAPQLDARVAREIEVR